MTSSPLFLSFSLILDFLFVAFVSLFFIFLSHPRPNCTFDHTYIVWEEEEPFKSISFFNDKPVLHSFPELDHSRKEMASSEATDTKRIERAGETGQKMTDRI